MNVKSEEIINFANKFAECFRGLWFYRIHEAFIVNDCET